MENKITCPVCGNEIDPEVVTCPFCDNALSKAGVFKRKRKFLTVNIKRDLPDLDTARSRLTAVLNMAKVEGIRVLKVIHGYGSSGKGGDIAWMVKQYLEKNKYSPVFKYYVMGEFFGSGYPEGKRIVSDFQQLRNDHDWNAHNRGITLIVMR